MPETSPDHNAIESAMRTLEDAEEAGLLHETLWSASQELGITPTRLADALFLGLCEWDK